MAGSSVVETSEQWGPIGVVTLTCTGDDTDGSYPATALLAKLSGFIVAIEANPGSPAPTNLYDLVLNDGDSIDVLLGRGANLLTATTEKKLAAALEDMPVYAGDTLTFTLTNNSVNDAVTVVKIYLKGQIRHSGQ